jgi:FMN phosphatase YigB (HAD superfamily)
LCAGVEEALESLSRSHMLALAANAPSSIKQVLDQLGVLRWFACADVSQDMGLAKPDVRFFEHIVARCGVRPEEAVMVGDRLDNDIIPAKLLGMKAVLVKVGRYAILEPRTPDEVPDATITGAHELPRAISDIARFGAER